MSERILRFVPSSSSRSSPLRFPKKDDLSSLRDRRLGVVEQPTPSSIRGPTQNRSCRKNRSDALAHLRSAGMSASKNKPSRLRGSLVVRRMRYARTKIAAISSGRCPVSATNTTDRPRETGSSHLLFVDMNFIDTTAYVRAHVYTSAPTPFTPKYENHLTVPPPRRFERDRRRCRLSESDGKFAGKKLLHPSRRCWKFARGTRAQTRGDAERLSGRASLCDESAGLANASL